jgi:hypothetical protein
LVAVFRNQVISILWDFSNSLILNKIFILVLGGSFIGAILVGVLVYFMLVMSGVKDALIKAVISIVIR